MRKLKTHCSRGHALDEANVLLSQGARRCRKCAAERAAAYRHRKAAQPRSTKHSPYATAVEISDQELHELIADGDLVFRRKCTHPVRCDPA